MLDPKRKYSKYLSFKGLSKSQNFKWQDTKDGVFDNYNTLSRGSTLIKIRYSGVPVDSILGYVKATWYVHTRA